MAKWIVTPNPMRTDGVFVCLVEPQRFYADVSPQMARAVHAQQIPHHVADALVVEHNKDVAEMEKLKQELEFTTKDRDYFRAAFERSRPSTLGMSETIPRAPSPAATRQEFEEAAEREEFRARMSRKGQSAAHIHEAEGHEHNARLYRFAAWLTDQTNGELRAQVATLIEARDRKKWVCFHCGDEFIEETEAREHFGLSQTATALCRLSSHDAHRLREIEKDNEELRSDNERLENDSRLWHESESDRVRRIGNCQWWQEMDSREGEKLVLTSERDEARRKVDIIERHRDDWKTIAVERGQRLDEIEPQKATLESRHAELVGLAKGVKASCLIGSPSVSTELMKLFAALPQERE